MAPWELLDEKAELELHKTRLLNVEEKPFKRITKRLTTVSSLVSSINERVSQKLDQDGDSITEPPKSKQQLQEDLILDFAGFDSSIARLQFLHNANARERERYDADQQRILSECRAVKANNAQLREQLDGARATLAQRKKFDDLAEKITSNGLLRPREDQITNLAKLEEECKELERESETYSETWRERREQFNRIMEEGMMLRRQIRDEKEEVDRREGMNEGGEDEPEGDRGGQTPRHDPSGDATPRPDTDSQLRVDGDAGTPRPDTSNGGRTPLRETPGPDSLQPLPGGQGTLSQGGSRLQSREGSPEQRVDDHAPDSGEDVDMDEPGNSIKATEDGGDTPRVTVDPPEDSDDKMEVDN